MSSNLFCGIFRKSRSRSPENCRYLPEMCAEVQDHSSTSSHGSSSRGHQNKSNVTFRNTRSVAVMENSNSGEIIRLIGGLLA